MPLVLLHANPGDSRDFEAIMPALAQHYRVLALDWPGYGASAMPPAGTVMNARFFYDAFCEFLAALALPPALIIGNSLGGNVAARLAIESRAKVRGLVLVSPGGFTPHNFITQAFCQLQGSRFALPPRTFAGWYLKHRTPTVRAMLERAATSQATAPSLAVNRSVWRGFIEAEHDLRQRATLIAAPTLLVFGARDPVISARQDGRLAASLIRGANWSSCQRGMCRSQRFRMSSWPRCCRSCSAVRGKERPMKDELQQLPAMGRSIAATCGGSA